MKTLKIHVGKLTANTMLAAALFIMIGCAGNPDTGATAKTGAKTPDTDIHTAAVTGNVEAVKQHIEAGSNLNERDPFGGSSPLISATVFGQPEVAKVLLEADGVDINFQNNDGSTALHTAAFFCRPEIVQMLLDKGADKTIKNSFGATPFDNVAGSFAEMKGAYDMMGTVLGPMGLKLDYAYIEKTRPVIASMLQ